MQKFAILIIDKQAMSERDWRGELNITSLYFHHSEKLQITDVQNVPSLILQFTFFTQ